MKVAKLATTGALAFVLVGATAVPQLVAISPVYAQEAATATARDASALPIIEGSAEKEEVVYATLSAQGAVCDLYVVNDLFVNEPALVRDYGSYEAVLNLTDESALAQEPDNVLCVVEAESFVYQGNLSTSEIPWNIRISYELDGEPVEPDALAGRSGALKIAIETEQNTSVDPSYFDNYLLQITCTLPLDRARDLEAPDGSVALAGSDTSVSFMAMPGKTGSFELTAKVEQFEMEGISIAAVPFSMALDLPDTDSLVAQFDQLIAGTRQLDAGATQLEQGAQALGEGADALDRGAAVLQAGSSDLASGIASYAEGVSQVSEGASQAADGSHEFATKLGELAQASDAIVASSAAGKEQISALEESVKNSTLSADEKAQMLASLAGLSARLDAAGTYAAGVKALPEGYAQLDASLEQLSSGLDALDQQGAQLSQGAGELEGGASQLAGSTGALSSGAGQIASGSQELAAGTSQLAEESERIPEKVRAQIDEMLADYDKSDFSPVSFVDPRNTNVKLVQFVMTTDAIHVPEIQEEEPEEQDETLLSRFFALFS